MNSHRDNPNHTWYNIIISKNSSEVESWCVEHFGKRWNLFDDEKGIWHRIWAPDTGGNNNHRRFQYSFRNETDAVMFALRWSNDAK